MATLTLAPRVARRVAALGLVALLAAPLAAATLHVGPGGFAQIADAIAASQPGDTIVVAPGTYQHFVVPHALRIVSDGSGTVTIVSTGQHGVRISGVPAGAEFVLSGIEVRANPILAVPQAAVFADQVAGTVVLHDVHVESPFGAVGVRATNCASVLILASRVLDGGPLGSPTQGGAIEAIDSAVVIADCLVTGDSGGGGIGEPGDHAVLVQGGSVEVWRSILRGGNGFSGKGIFVTANGGDGVRAIGAIVANYGGPASEVRGGKGGQSQPFGAPGQGGAGVRLASAAVCRTQSGVLVVGGLDVSGQVQAPSFVVEAGSVSTLHPATFATLEAPQRVALGNFASLDLTGNAGGLIVVHVAARSGPRLALPGVVGTGALDLTWFAPLEPFVLDGTGQGSQLVGLALPWLVDQTLWFQAVEFSATHISITNPVVVSVTN